MADGSWTDGACPEIAAALGAAYMAPTPAFVWALDPAGRADTGAGHLYLLSVNDAYEREAGVDRAAFAGQTLDALLPPRAAAAVLTRYRRAIAEGHHAYEEEIDVSSGARWWSTALRALTDASGACVGLFGVSTDITATRRQAEAGLAENARLRRLAEEVRVFSSMAAHDVRVPLGTVEALIEMVAENFEDMGDGKLALLRHAQGVCRTARGQMDDLLRHAASLEDAPETRVPVDLAELSRDVTALLDPEGRVRIAHPEGRLVCDRVLLHLVLRNLVSNAVRHARGRVRIGAAPPGPDGLATFTVADDGPGFAAGADPFSANAEARLTTARGFGLAAARYLLEARGGGIAAVPSALGGAAMRFTLAAEPAPRGA